MSNKMSSVQMLHEAIVNRDVDTVKRVLEECPNWNTDSNGETVLHLAFKCKNKSISNQNAIIKILECFMEKGLSVDLKNVAGQTVLFLAVQNRLRLVIDYLVQCGANLNVQDQNGNTIIHTLIEDQSKQFPKSASSALLKCVEQDDINFIKWLLSKGVNTDCQNNDGKTAFDLTVERNLKHVTHTLMEYINDVNSIGKEGYMIIESFFKTRAHLNNNHHSHSWDIEMLKFLLEKGASANLTDMKGNTLLHMYLKSHNPDTEIIQRMLQSYTKVNAQDQDGNTALHLLIRNSLVKSYTIRAVHTLISKGANVNLKNNFGQSIIQQAFRVKNTGVLNALLEFGADLSPSANPGALFLHEISIIPSNDDQKWAPMVDTLVQAGWNVNEVRPSDGFTPLMEACRSRCPLITHKLIDNGANVNSVYRDGTTCVHMILKYCSANSELVQRILPLYTNVNAQDKDGNTALHLVTKIKYSNFYYYQKPTLDAVRTLLSNGANINLKNHIGDAPVRLAIRFKLFEVLKVLLDYGADLSPSANPGAFLLHEISIVDNHSFDDRIWAPMVDTLVQAGWNVNDVRPSDGFTPLMEACRSNCPAIAQKLIDAGANVNCVDKNGATSVHMILKNYRADSEMIQRILPLYTNVNAQDKDGNTALHLVIKNSYYHENRTLDAVRSLLSNGTNVNLKNHVGDTPVRLAIRFKLFVLLKVLLEYGADLSPSVNPGSSFLHDISSFTTEDDQTWAPMIDTLVHAGWNVNDVRPDDDFTPLMEACRSNCPAIAQKLMENGADVNYVENRDLMRPIHMVAMGGRANQDANTETLLKMLVKAGAKVNVQNNRGETALHLAADRGYSTMGQLLQLGARVNVRDNLGRSPLQEAARIGNVGSIEALLYFGAEVNDAGVLKELQTLNCSFYNYISRGKSAVDCLTEHWLKLKAANLPIMDGFADFAKKESLQEFYVECLREVETMKAHHLNDRITLYDLLHMNIRSKFVFIVKNEKLKKLVMSPSLDNNFPKYSILIIACYNKAITRHPLVEPAKRAWHDLTGITLPDCVEKILTYLSNEDLSVMATEEEDVNPLKRPSKLTLGTPTKRQRLEQDLTL